MQSSKVVKRSFAMMTVFSAAMTMVASWIENEEEEEERVKKFPFSKPKGVVLENEKKNLFKIKRNMVTFGC